MKIATWNVNGIKARLEQLKTWLGESQPDIACLQEIKSVDEGFPREEIEGLGYNLLVHGQKGFNGVAILSKLPIEEAQRGLPGEDEDSHSRYIEGVVGVGGGVVRVASIYLPNGNPIGTDKFAYKLRWMERLQRHIAGRLALEEPAVFAGDYNVIPEPIDAKRPEAWVEDALYQPESRGAWRKLSAMGLTDAIRACHPGPGVYTFWDYQAGAFQKDHGIRIDHLMLSPQAADKLNSAGIDRFTRSWERPSDHVPVWVELDV